MRHPLATRYRFFFNFVMIISRFPFNLDMHGFTKLS
jgi:hypothetical protein